MPMSWLAQTVRGLQKEKEDIALITVLSKSGSAPCLAGSKMVVRSDGTSIGTVGGGGAGGCRSEKGSQGIKNRDRRNLVI